MINLATLRAYSTEYRLPMPIILYLHMLVSPTASALPYLPGIMYLWLCSLLYVVAMPYMMPLCHVYLV